jgi:predicted secreted protein
MIATTTIPLAYASSTTPTLPFVSYEEIGEPQKQLINDTLEQVRKAIMENPQDVRITIYPGELPDKSTMYIVQL